MLYIFGGLPGTGKSTLARRLAHMTGGMWLRIDSIEQAIRDHTDGLVGPEGYAVAQAVAADNLRLGRVVIADSVNPLEITRAAWRAVASAAGTPSFEIEVICSDADEHRRRVEQRQPSVPGLKQPDWAAVRARRWEPWVRPHLVIDTSGEEPAESQAALLRALGLRH